MSKLAQDINSVGAELFEGRLAQDINSVDAELVQETTVLSLTAPANGQTDVPLSMTFSWTDSESRGLYRLVYDTDINFGNPTIVWTETTSHNATLTSGTYYWKVEAHNPVQQDAFVPETTGFDSQSGDEAFLDALSASVTGFDASWDTPISLDSGSSPGGITTELIGGEYRVTEVDLRSNVNAFSALSGSVDIPEWSNLKSCRLINIAYNNFDTQYPNAIHDIGASLEYLYLNYSDDQLENDQGTGVGIDDQTLHPHEYIAQQTPPFFEAGKESSRFGDNTIRGSVNDNIDNLTNLKGFVIAFADDFGISSRVPNAINGIESVSENIWNITTLEIIVIYDCWNIAGSGNTFSFPSTISHIPNLKEISLGGGSGTNWDEFDQGFVVGTYPSDMGQLTQLIGVSTARNALLKGLPDLSGSTALEFYNFGETNYNSENFPSFVVDGTLPNMDIVSLSNPSGDPMTGTLPTTWNVPGLDLFAIGYNEFTGSVPFGLWDTDPNKINLRYNFFTSIGTQDLTILTSMSTIRYHNNDIGGEPIPYINFDSNQWNRVRFDSNRYVFADMLYVPPNAPSGETAFELYAQMTLTNFGYGNQRPFGTASDQEATTGNTVIFSDFNDIYTHFANIYQWQKSTDTGSTWTNISDGGDISGATTKELTIANVDSNDDALYRLQVTNSLFDNICTTYGLTTMTLNSNEISLEVI